MDTIQFLIGGEEHVVGAEYCDACRNAGPGENPHTVPCFECGKGRIHIVQVIVDAMGLSESYYACDHCEYEVTG